MSYNPAPPAVATAPVTVDDNLDIPAPVGASVTSVVTVTANDTAGSLPIASLALIDPVTDLESQLVNFSEGVFAVDDADDISFTTAFPLSGGEAINSVEYVSIDSAGTRSNRSTINTTVSAV